MIYKIPLTMTALLKTSKRLHTNFIQTVVIITRSIGRVFTIAETQTFMFQLSKLKHYELFVISFKKIHKLCNPVAHFQVIIFAYKNPVFFQYLFFFRRPMKYFKIHLYSLYRFLKVG